MSPRCREKVCNGRGPTNWLSTYIISRRKRRSHRKAKMRMAWRSPPHGCHAIGSSMAASTRTALSGVRRRFTRLQVHDREGAKIESYPRLGPRKGWHRAGRVGAIGRGLKHPVSDRGFSGAALLTLADRATRGSGDDMDADMIEDESVIFPRKTKHGRAVFREEARLRSAAADKNALLKPIWKAAP